MKKKLSIALLSGLAPFLFIWIAWVMTAFSFDVHDVFQSSAFWYISGIYWFVYACMILPVLDAFDQ